jgi:hypothetical protein
MKKVIVVLTVVLITSCIFTTHAGSHAVNSNTVIAELAIGDEYLGGIVFYIYKDADGKQHGYVVGKTEISAAWQDPPSLLNASKTTAGPDNYNLMTNSPAKDWITANYDKEWYMPTLNELNMLWGQRLKINEVLKAKSGTLLALDGYYWASREYGERNAYFWNFEVGDLYTEIKTVKFSVRPIRAF